MKKLSILCLAIAAPVWASDLNVSVESGGLNEITVAPGAIVNYEVHGLLSDNNSEGLGLVGFSLNFIGGDLAQANSPTGVASCQNQMRNFVIPEGITNPAGYGGTVIGGDLIQVGGGQNTINNTAETGAAFPIGTVLPGVAKPAGCGEAVLVTGSLTAPVAAGDYELQLFDLFANVIKLGETGVPFWATEAAGAGQIVNLTIHVQPACNLVSSAPAHRHSLWRTQRNIMRLTFDCDITTPPAGSVLIQSLIGAPSGTFGPNLSAGFTFTVENNGGGQPRILKIQETASTLVHRTWYSVRNTGGWLGVANFNLQLLCQMGDASDNNFTQAADATLVYTNGPPPNNFPCLAGCGDANRRDINGDGRVQAADATFVYGKVPSAPVAVPPGH